MKVPIDIADPIAEGILVKQVHSLFTEQIYTCNEKQAVQLASLFIQFTYGDHDPKKHRIGFLK